MSRSTIFTTLFALSLLAPIGCAVTSSDGAEEVAETQDELSSVAQSLVGTYYDHAVPFAGVARITLESNGTYKARIEAGGRALCITSPCLLPETGTWNAVTSNGKVRLRLRATGEAARWYDANKTTGKLEITSAGKTQTLTQLGANQCLDSADCSADQECAPRFCLMFCAAGDPFCCGPSTCKPKAPAKKFCGGFAGIPCGANEECVDDPTDGCDPQTGGADCGGICQPKAPAKKFCGGFAGIPCGANEECVDDPTDSCDPQTGGADCGGICRPKAL